MLTLSHTRASPSWLVVLALGMAGCAPSKDERVHPDDTGTPDVVGNTDTPGHTDPAAHSDTAPDTDAVGDTDGPRLAPLPTPTSWGPGFLPITGAIVASGGLTPHPGTPGTGDGLIPPQPMVAFAADLNEDGVDEIIVSTGGRDPGHVPQVRIYRDTGGAVVAAGAAIHEAVGTRSHLLLGGLDVDDDGHVDLLTEHWRELVAFGRGNGSFLAPWGIDTSLPGAWGVAGGMTLDDLDGDGWLDLVVGGRDCQHTLVAAQRTGSRTWTWRPDWLEDVAPFARVEALTTWRTAQGQHLIGVTGASCDLHEPWPGFFEVHRTGTTTRLVATDLNPDPASWTQDPALFGRPTFSQAMPMGMHPTDVDGDGDVDLWLTLGVSWMVPFLDVGAARYQDAATRIAVPLEPVGATVHHVPWGMASIDLDLDGQPDLLTAIGDDDTSFQRLTGAATRNLAWWHGRTWQYEEVGAELGLTHTGSFHALGVADLDRDGDADPFFGGFGVPPVLYRNAIDTGHHGLSLRLHGTTSNHLGIGAVVEVHAAGLPMRTHQVTLGGSPGTLSDPLVFAGAGANTSVDRVVVHWPSGTTQAWEHLPTGALHTLEEAPTITVLPTGRHLPAGGTATATIRVTPRTLQGDVDPTATVEVLVSGDPGAVSMPVWTGEAWQVQVTPALLAGSSRVTVRVNGADLPIQPRLWWDAP